MNEDEVSVGDNIFLFDISELDDKYLSSDTLRDIRSVAELYSINLERVVGRAPVKPAEFSVLVRRVELFLQAHPKAILCFYCDFLNEIPSIRKTRSAITVQEYRSRLFTALFDRYRRHHNCCPYIQSVITVEGEENYYIHIIALSNLSFVIEKISKDLQDAYGKD